MKALEEEVEELKLDGEEDDGEDDGEDDDEGDGDAAVPMRAALENAAKEWEEKEGDPVAAKKAKLLKLLHLADSHRN